MTKRREFNLFCPSSDYFGDDFGYSYGALAMIWLYAAELDPVQGRNLYYRLVPNFTYCDEQGLPLPIFDIDSMEGYFANFNITEMQEAINFIKNDLIPHLESEERDAYTIYGGRKNIVKLMEEYNTNSDLRFDIEDEDFLDTFSLTVIYMAEHVQRVLQDGIDFNAPYYTYIT